jgi:NAD(P)-dependent dehydrogenase (short-subunit alcohol dehydrogenase family)
LTNRLLPLLKKAAQQKVRDFVPRVVVVSSDAAKLGKVNTSYWEKQNQDKLPYFFGRYGDTKLQFCMVSKKLADSVESDGVLVHMIHPGFVATGKPNFVIYPLLLDT